MVKIQHQALEAAKRLHMDDIQHQALEAAKRLHMVDIQHQALEAAKRLHMVDIQHQALEDTLILPGLIAFIAIHVCVKAITCCSI